MSKLGLAIFLKLFQYEGRFPTRRAEVPRANVKFIADQIDVPIGFFEKYKWKGWMIKTHRAQIRKLSGYKKWSRRFTDQIVEKLVGPN